MARGGALLVRIGEFEVRAIGRVRERVRGVDVVCRIDGRIGAEFAYDRFGKAPFEIRRDGVGGLRGLRESEFVLGPNPGVRKRRTLIFA